MKPFLIILALLHLITLNAQNSLKFGHYVTTFSEIGFFNQHLELNEDLTFQYESKGDMHYEYLSGKYIIKNDTLKLTIDPNQVNEYFTYLDSTSGKIDTLFLGDRNKNSRVTNYIIENKKLIALDPKSLEIQKVYNYRGFKKALKKEGVKKKRIRKLKLIEIPFRRWGNVTIPSNQNVPNSYFAKTDLASITIDLKQDSTFNFDYKSSSFNYKTSGKYRISGDSLTLIDKGFNKKNDSSLPTRNYSTYSNFNPNGKLTFKMEKDCIIWGSKNMWKLKKKITTANNGYK